jgi:predicted LPLAT superfamily acyltransferase
MSSRHGWHWAHLGESTFVAGIWFLYGVYRLLGRWPMRVFLYPVVAYYWLARPVARAASMEYLHRMQAAHGALGAQPGWTHSIRHFLSFAETILDKVLAFSGRYRFEGLRFEGRDIVDEMIARGQGGILMTAHIGCLELCQASAVRQPGLQLNILVHTRHAERFNRILQRLNPDNPVRLLQVTEVDAATAVMLADRVAAGEFVAIVGDRVPVRASQTADALFLGRSAPFPVGGYVLAALIKCPVLLMSCVRERGGHRVCFELLAECIALPRARRAEQLALLVTQFAGWLEAQLVHAPYEWFNFFSFWAQPVAAPSPSYPASPHERSAP